MDNTGACLCIANLAGFGWVGALAPCPSRPICRTSGMKACIRHGAVKIYNEHRFLNKLLAGGV